METDAAAGGESANLAGIALVVTGVGLLVTMDGFAKWLVGADYSPVQIIAMRGWIIVAMLVAWVPRAGGLAAFRTRRKKGLLLRVAFGFLMPFFFFSALKQLPLADVTVILFGAPFIMTALSVPLFSERVGVHRWSAVAIGFVGVLVAARPGAGVFAIEALYAFGACVCYALLMLATRWLARTESTFLMVFSYNLGVAAGYSLLLPFVFRPMPIADLAILASMAVLAVGGQVCLTRAYSLAEIAAIAPFEYTALAWAALIGFVVWGDVPAGHVVAGAAVIAGCGLYVVHREKAAGRRRPADPAPEGRPPAGPFA